MQSENHFRVRTIHCRDYSWGGGIPEKTGMDNVFASIRLRCLLSRIQKLNLFYCRRIERGRSQGQRRRRRRRRPPETFQMDGHVL